MQTKYHEKLKEVAETVIDFIINTYGFTEFEGQFYCNYLLRSTSKNKDDFQDYFELIKTLQNNYDVNLEPFKMTYKDVIEHLGANGYFIEISQKNGKSIFNCYKKTYEKGKFGIVTENSKFEISKIKNEFENKEYDYISNILEDFSIIAIQHLEHSEFS